VHIAAGGYPDDFEKSRTVDKRHSDSKGAVLAKDLQDLINRDSSSSMRPIVKEMDVSECVVQKLMSEDLCYK
jgi:hypothetical protein